MLKLKEKILSQIKMGQEISPFLFVNENTQLLNFEVEKLAKSILNDLKIPQVYLFELETEEKNIKIHILKEFLKKTFSKTPYKIQILLIKNIEKATVEALNSSLKIFEEPGKQNLIFLTTKSEFGILETVLSRVQIIRTGNDNKYIPNEEYIKLIKSYIEKENVNLIEYIFNKKLEKEDYFEILKNLLYFLEKNKLYISFLEELNEDIYLIYKNNVSSKYILDKWLLKI